MTSEILREREFYDALSDCLKERKFAKFESLINESITRDIFIDPKKIPNRFLILNELLIECMQNVSEGYQTSSLGDFIDILRFFNQHGLFERNLTNKELEIAEKYGKDQILIAALIDLCGGASSYFISYLFKDVATLIYNLFINNPSSYFVDAEGFFEYIKSGFFNLYTIYGLSVRYLCPVDQFIKELEPITNFSTKNENQNEKNDNDFVRINLEYRNVYYDYVTEIPREQTEIKTHLVSISNIIRFLFTIIIFLY